MILLLDNYDSFTYNLYQFLSELGADVRVVRNDAVTLEDIQKMAPEKIVISPGPCTPNEAGNSKEIVEAMGPTLPILGVCLGHQCIGAVYGGRIVRADAIMHGKVSRIRHMDNPIFKDVESPFEATRYH